MTNAEANQAVYAARIARWATRIEAMTFTAEEADGLACVACGTNRPVSAVPVGHGPAGQVFACAECADDE